MTQIKVLPMKMPPITCYPYQANLLSVILNHDQALPWFYNNFIQLESPKKNDWGMRIDFYSSLLWKTCPWIYYQRISREMVHRKWSITDFIIDSIELGYYVYFNVDVFYVSSYSYFQKEHYIHDIFIYGYDDDKKMFYVADNFKQGIYSYENVPFDEIEAGYHQISLTSGGALEGEIDWLNGIELINFRNKYGFDFDIELLLDDLTDYLQSVNRYKKTWVRSDMFWKENCRYGLAVYDVLKDYLRDVIDGRMSFDIRPFFVLYEHKSVMLSRIKYLMESGWVHHQELYHDYSLNVKHANAINTLWIKYICTNDSMIIESMISLLTRLKEAETLVLQKLVQELLNNKNNKTL